MTLLELKKLPNEYKNNLVNSIKEIIVNSNNKNEQGFYHYPFKKSIYIEDIIDSAKLNLISLWIDNDNVIVRYYYTKSDKFYDWKLEYLSIQEIIDIIREM